MTPKKIKKALTYALLAGWCLLFLRCETTEKSMVRAVYLARAESFYRIGLLYQAPEAAADASEASAALQFVQAGGNTLEQAFAVAEDALPQTASYRLCDYLLLPEVNEDVLTEYEQLVLRRSCGRTAAKMACVEGVPAVLEEEEVLPDMLLSELKAAADTMPRLYQHGETILLPCLQWNPQQVHRMNSGLLHDGTQNTALSVEEAEVYRLLTGTGGTRSFWLEGQQFTVRHSTVSITLQREQVLLRLDCQRTPQSPLPTERQQAVLAEQCTVLVQRCWQQGIDLLHLGAHAALRDGSGAAFDPTKNACPQIRTDVRFLPV